MTEASDDDNYLVTVRAQVMTRDDSSGGWVPLSGGGLANVSVRRRPIASTGTTNNETGTPATYSSQTAASPVPTSTNNSLSHSTTSSSQHQLGISSSSTTKNKQEYYIYGKRISDESVVLSCTIKKDFEYNKVAPTFHHWRTSEKKFGLTFLTPADARTFDKGVRRAVEELLEGLAEQTSLSDGNVPADAGDDEVFMTLNLPVDAPEPIRQPIESKYHGVLRSLNHPPLSSDHLESLNRPYHYKPPSILKMPPPLPHHNPLESDATDLASDNYPYVQLTTLNHEYMYPVIDDQHRKPDRLNRSNSADSLKKPDPDILVTQPKNSIGTFPGKGSRSNPRQRCKHCQEWYSEQENSRGACEYAPDPVKRGISTVSCLSCAQCMLYHCMSDAEGDFAQNPCSCSTEEGCGRRWLSLALLSVIVPCLWCYPPLRAVHWCGMSCGICGGRHHPME
ncbi:hypothetical protein QAD02_014690 [Eretmocerus hayati]|uniref:Uncharacterized protein n=1 Tax=Eretmocerus hayati TaxID=131215 RepID=A0ACC2P740_9HYME|nr:hypothetical protein QAD02_014690 [Eretmocerus hayati]